MKDSASKNTLLILITTLLMLVSLLGISDYIIRNYSRESVTLWYTNEYMSIRQGNVLSSVTKLESIIDKSSILKSVKVIDDKSNVIMKKGNDFSQNSNNLNKSNLYEIEIERYNVFQYIFSIKLPNLKILVLTGSIITQAFIFILGIYVTIITYILNNIISKNKLSITKLKHENELNLLKEKIKNDEAIINITTKVAHDIRSPIAVINSLKKDFIATNSNDEGLFFHALDSINQIADDLLFKSKANTHNQQQFNLNIYLSELIKLKNQEKNCNIIFIDNSFNSLIILDKLKFSRSFSNLLNNAIEATEKSNQMIEVSLSNFENYIKISIKDNGYGIPESLLEQLGKKNVSTKSKEKGSGNGIGLKSAFDFISEIKGKINIESKTDEGTNITLFIPILTPSSAPLSVLVDDDELTRMNWEYKAKKAGIELKIFKNQTELMENLKDIPKEATIYLDSELGTDKGEDIAKKLHDQGYVSIYMATGHGSEKFQELSFLKGVIDKNPPF